MRTQQRLLPPLKRGRTGNNEIARLRARARVQEARFGHDFSQARVHAGERAAPAARAVNALAYTAGNDVVFGQERSAPGTLEGQRLLAHELTHTPQQPIHWLRAWPRGDAAEKEARSVAEAVIRARPVRITAYSGHTIARASDDTLDAGTLQDASLPGGSATELATAQAPAPSETSNEGPNTRAQRAAAVISMLASNRPDCFVDLVDLPGEKGLAWLGSEKLTAGDDLRQHTPPEPMARIDWMLLSSMRDAENSLFDLEGTPGEDVSATFTPGALDKKHPAMQRCRPGKLLSVWRDGCHPRRQQRRRGNKARGGPAQRCRSAGEPATRRKDRLPHRRVVLTAPIVETTDASGAQRSKISTWTWEQSPRFLTRDMDVFFKRSDRDL